MEDSQIVALYWARSQDAITKTAEKYGAYCHNISYGILRSQQDAEECVSDTWLRTWNALPPQKPASLGAFVARIVRNLSLDRYRMAHAAFRGGGQVLLAMEEVEWALPTRDPMAELTDEEALTEALERFLAGLSRQKRWIFLLRYWYFRSPREISDQLGLPKNTVTSALRRTRLALKEFLKQEGIHV